MNLLVRQQLLLMIRALYIDMESKWTEIGKKYNVSPAQQHILFLLSTHDNELTPTRISELGCWHNSTVTRILNRLQKNGYIYVKTQRNHLGFKVVSMTEEGKWVLEKLIEKVQSMEQFPFDMRTLSNEEVLSFLDYGIRILDVQKGEGFKNEVLTVQVEGCDYA